MREWLGDWKSLHGMDFENARFFDKYTREDGSESRTSIYAEAYVLGVRAARRISDQISDPFTIDPQELPPFDEAADHYENLADDPSSAVLFQEGFKQGYRDKLRASM